MSELIPSKWLGEGFDMFVANEPDLVEAYNLPPYPSEMSGEGNWVVLYMNGDEPLAILWHGMPDSVGIEPVIGTNTDILNVENCRLRLHQLAGLSAAEAYQEIAGRYTTSDEQTGNLDDAKRMLVSAD